MRVLSLGVDASVAKGLPAQDLFERFEGYALACTEYHAILYTARTTDMKPFSIGDKVYVYPTASRSKAAFFWDASQMVRRIATARGIDLIFTQDVFATGLVGAWAKKTLGLPVCFSFHGDILDNPYWVRESWTNRVWNAIGKGVLGYGDSFRVVSSLIGDRLRGFGVPADRIHTVPAIIRMDSFLHANGTAKRSQLLNQLGVSKLLLFVGRLVPQKDIPNLLRAMRVIVEARRDVGLAIVGGGPLLEGLKELAQELGIASKVSFEGSVAPKLVAEYHAAADVFVLSSLYEGNARVLAEAGAAGRPVVATDISGTRDTVVDGVTGYVVPHGQPEVLAHKVFELLDDEEQARVMGARARERVMGLWTPEAVAPRLRNMFEQTASGRVGRAVG